MRAVRLAAGMTRDQVAEALNVSGPTVTSWEQDRVDEVPAHRIEAFAELTSVPIDWLTMKVKQTPKALFDQLAQHFDKKRQKRHGDVPTSPRLHFAAANDHSPGDNIKDIGGAANAEVLEIRPTMKAHANGIDTEKPEARWMIPAQVLKFSFNCDPDSVVMKRVMTPCKLPDGTPVHRGDYFLIDSSRNDINETGIWYVTDPEGKEAKRAHVTLSDVTQLSMVLEGHPQPVEISGYTVLGRVMSVFHSA
ncbi:helix-turn-helix domain-containing protein [Bradyrhizobium sp. S3.7.6]